MKSVFQAKVLVAEQTEKDIDQTRSQYIPVAINTQIMFFCVAAMANIDPMYQYSLEWFVGIFLGGIAQAERAGIVNKNPVQPTVLYNMYYETLGAAEMTSVEMWPVQYFLYYFSCRDSAGVFKVG